ncbi:MAG: phasin family protein [Methylocella sp.]
MIWLNEMTSEQLRKTLLDEIELNLEEMEMTKESDNIQNAGNGQPDAAAMDYGSFTTILQAIFAEGAGYTKKSVETRLACGEKLLGAKSFDTVIQIQSDYAKTSYAAFIAQATKMGELRSTLAKAAFKPAEQAIAAMQGMQGAK